MKCEKATILRRLEWFVKHVELRRIFLGKRYPLAKIDCQSMGFPRVILPLRGIKYVTIAMDGQIKRQKLVSGDILFLGTHCWKIPCWETAHEYISIVFSSNNLLRFVYIDHHGDSKRGLCSPDTYYHIENISDNCTVRLLKLLDMFSTSHYPIEIALKLCDCLIRTALCELREAEYKPIGKATHTWHRVTQFMQDNYLRRLDRLVVAKALSITPEHVSLLFRRFAQTTFSSYLNNLRLVHAAYLLKDSDLTVDEVATKCGYGNSQCFIRVFKRQYSITPSAFRTGIKKKLRN